MALGVRRTVRKMVTVPGGWAVGVIQAKREGKGKQGKEGAIPVEPEGGNEHELVLSTL